MKKLQWYWILEQLTADTKLIESTRDAEIAELKSENERLLSYAQYIPCICSAVSLAMVPPNYHSNCKRHSFLNREQVKQL